MGPVQMVWKGDGLWWNGIGPRPARAGGAGLDDRTLQSRSPQTLDPPALLRTFSVCVCRVYVCCVSPSGLLYLV